MAGAFKVQLSPSQDHVSLSWRPDEGDWLAETASDSDQVAGDLFDPVQFSTVAHLGSAGGTWHQDTPSSAYPYNTNSNGVDTTGSTSDFSIYDERYCGVGIKCP